MCLNNVVTKSFINADISIMKSFLLSVISVSVFFGLDNPVSSEDRSRATETGRTPDYTQINMTSLNANIPYDSLQPTYLQVR